MVQLTNSEAKLAGIALKIACHVRSGQVIRDPAIKLQATFLAEIWLEEFQRAILETYKDAGLSPQAGVEELHKLEDKLLGGLTGF